MGEHFAGTRYEKYFLGHDVAEALHEVGGVIPGPRGVPMVAG